MRYRYVSCFVTAVAYWTFYASHAKSATGWLKVTFQQRESNIHFLPVPQPFSGWYYAKWLLAGPGTRQDHWRCSCWLWEGSAGPSAVLKGPAAGPTEARTEPSSLPWCFRGGGGTEPWPLPLSGQSPPVAWSPNYRFRLEFEPGPVIRDVRCKHVSFK